MRSFKLINYSPVSFLLLFLLIAAPVVASSAQKIVKSSDSAAGFSFATDSGVTEPIIYYQKNIQMLSSIPDRQTLSIYGDGRVVVHYPAYMKKAGDYEMKLSEAELIELVQSLSSNGVLDFNEARVKKNIQLYKKALHAKGQFHEVSDAVVTSIAIRLDEYQKNKTEKNIKDFHKTFRWSNIEHTTKRFKQDADMKNANNSVLDLKALAKDVRLVKMESK